MAAGSVVRVEHDGSLFLVTLDGVFAGAFDGPVLFRPDDPANQFTVESIRRTFGTTQRPRYRGAMEVGRGATTAGLTPPRVNLVNIVQVEDYVPGVVANESIASFAIAALRAQAVAARGYAIANIGNYVARGYPFDIVDSSASQVYRGVISEHVNAVRAAADTYGLVASSNGRIISAMYSSSFGGHSDSNEWISFTNNVKAGGAPLSYLRGIYDGVEPAPDFSSAAGIEFFWRSQPPVLPLFYDDCVFTGNGFSRWKFTLPATVLKGRLTTGNSTLVSGTRTGPMTNVEIVERSGSAQRAIVARVTLTTGVLEIRGWESLRQTIGRTNTAGTPRACGTSTIAASFVLNSPSAIDVVVNADGTAGNLTVYGGGWGHNLGMSQYGAHGRGKSGYSFIEILQAYYTGVDVGSFPIDIGRTPGSAPTLRQQFVAPTAQGTLQIRATDDLKGLRVHLNELYDLSFDAAALASGLLEVDVSPYLVPGINVIQPGRAFRIRDRECRGAVARVIVTLLLSGTWTRMRSFSSASWPTDRHRSARSTTRSIRCLPPFAPKWSHCCASTVKPWTPFTAGSRPPLTESCSDIRSCPGLAWVPMNSLRPWVPGEWERFTRRGTRGWVGRSPSKSCRLMWPAIRI
jgi:peptidoglycan hydrolase-like amidase